MLYRKLVVSLIAAACLLSTTRPARTAALAPLDKVRVGLGGPILNLDPLHPQETATFQPGVLIAGQLFRFDANRQPQPDLVESYTISDDGLTYTMTLRKDLKYSDGSPLTVEDVVYNWNRIKDLLAIDRAWGVSELETPDATILVWKLSAPLPDFLQFLSLHHLQVHPKAKIEADKDYFAHPVSAGPYTLKAWTPGSSTALLEENPNYVHGPMAIKQIEFVSVPDVTARALQLAQGDLDYVFDLAPSVRDVITKDVKTVAHPLAGMYTIAFNLAQPRSKPLANRDVREAISLVIDREAISKRAFYGLSTPATGFLYASAGDLLLANFPNGGKPDPQAARALLAKTPFKDGFEFTLVVSNTRPDLKEAALGIQENLRDLNIKANIDTLDAAAAVRELTNGNFEAHLGDTVVYPPLTFLGSLFLHGEGWTRYNSPEMPALFQQAADNDPRKRPDAIHQIQALAYRDLPYIAISERFVLTGTRIPDDLLVATTPGEYLVVKRLASQ